MGSYSIFRAILYMTGPAPDAFKRAPFKKDHGPDAGPVMYRIALNIEHDPIAGRNFILVFCSLFHLKSYTVICSVLLIISSCSLGSSVVNRAL